MITFSLLLMSSCNQQTFDGEISYKLEATHKQLIIGEDPGSDDGNFGWVVGYLPMDMVRDLIGAEEVDQCMEVADYLCRVELSQCAELLINLDPEDPSMQNAVLQLYPSRCQEALDKAGVGMWAGKEMSDPERLDMLLLPRVGASTGSSKPEASSAEGEP